MEFYSYVVDWDELRDVQLSSLKSSVANCEIQTDHAIFASLWRMALKNGDRFILTGSNFVTEALMQYSWGHYHQDLKHMKAIHRRFSSKPLRTTPTIIFVQYLYYVFVKGIRQIPLINYIEYNKVEAKKRLKEEIGWRDYGDKHYESIWTRFFQGYYLPNKFGFDKRK